MSARSEPAARFRRPIVLTGGGTGGHVYPALAVADALRAARPDAELFYVGARGGIEESIAARHAIPFRRVVTAPYPGLGQPVALLRFAAIIAAGTLMALFHLLRLRPQILVATGGYVAAPAVFAAVLLRRLRLSRVRVFVHEQNTRPGRLNMLVARFADVVGVSFRGSERFLTAADVRYVGYPVRPSLRDSLAGTAAEDAPAGLLACVPPGKKVVLAFGGSQGARTVNRAVVDALVHLQERDDVFVVHGVGRRQRSGYDPEADVAGRIASFQSDGTLRADLSELYRSTAYIDDIGRAYEAASIVVCRGGAGTVKEVCAVGRPSVVLPKAGLAGDHQVMNALVLEEAGAARVLLEEPAVVPGGGLVAAVPGQSLASAIVELLDHPERLERMAAAARSLDDPAALQRIRAALSCGDAPPDVPGHPTEPRIEVRLAEKPPAQLLEHVRVHRRAGAAPSDVPGFAYLRYRAASMLTASAWGVRNVGVKLAGLLQLEDLVPLLRHLADDPTPARRLARLLGGDRQQNGFIRRNIVASLRQIGAVDGDVEAIVRASMTDRYFEVRREACNAVWQLPGLSSTDWARDAVVERLADRSFEVRMAAVAAAGHVLDMDEGLSLLRRFYLDANWKIRDAVLQAFDVWSRRADAAKLERLRAEFDGILLTGGGYRAQFGLKQTARELSARLQPGNGEVPP